MSDHFLKNSFSTRSLLLQVIAKTQMKQMKKTSRRMIVPLAKHWQAWRELAENQPARKRTLRAAFQGYPTC
jgi:hypothetical protein